MATEDARRWDAVARARAALDALERLVGGMGTAVLAVAALLWLLGAAVLCLAGVGLLLVPAGLRLLRVVADRERARLAILPPPPVPRELRAALADTAVRRELGWLGCHSTLGTLLGLTALTLPVDVMHDASFPLWWRFVPPSSATPAQGFFTATNWRDAVVICLFGVATLVVTVLVLPVLARCQEWPGKRLLAPARGTDLALRVAELTATRAAALDAHAVELRRIERSLHDGTQNRLVAVNVLLGAAKRALARDPAAAEEIIGRAQDAGEQALAELRGVVRSILPPVLTERSLPDALTALAADCPVTCRIDTDLPGRPAVSVQVTAYFVVAEALTNVARHSGASAATVRLRHERDRVHVEVTDDGRGGAAEDAGSGLVGIRRRVEAHDGTFALASPAGGPTTLVVSLPCGS
ncbi:sensor domain-containing protein [Amycolatopsis sp. A133]|uniref:sensor histidine kinase n=1 Tax=Amycolatopsis sp. A133 TaxID=3064472 RepID=UPI0027F69146|nr:sensor domain-containing protein [Amycolatopsis sp. A133]MDQ7810508.1 sensor domain-containing protein [Amycolatopsis sp. A133]